MYRRIAGVSNGRAFSVSLRAGLTALALILVGCSGSHTLSSSTGPDIVAPPGVDRALWARLTAELDRVISEEGTARRTDAAPTGPGSRVPDLTVHEDGGQAVFTWSYRQHGDYDLNGVVTVSDLTQVGVYFGKTTLDDDWQVAQLADGDGNGEVGVSDVTPIGQNFGGSIDGYELQGRADSNSDFQLKTDMVFAPGDKLSGIYPQFAYSSPPIPAGPEYRVVPYVDSGGGREYGTPSNILSTLHGFDDYWHTKNANNHRDNLAGSEGPAADPQAWKVPLEGGVLLQSPIVGPLGNIYIGTYDQTTGLEFSGPGYAYSFDQSGESNWRFKTKYGIGASAAASRNGRVIFTDAGAIVYCLAPDGKQLWRRQLSGLLAFSSPLVDDVGNVFVLTHTLSGNTLASSTLFKLLPDGSIDWSRPLNDSTLSSPFLNSQGDVTVIDDSAELYSYDYSGTLTHNFVAPDLPMNNGPFAANIAIRGPLIAYSTSAASVRLITEDASITVAVNLGEDPISGPALSAGNNIIIGTSTIPPPDPIYKLNHYTGAVKDWDMAIPGDTLGGIAVDPADRIYIATFLTGDTVLPGTNGISCIRPDQTVAWFYSTEDAYPFSPVVADDNLVVCVLISSLTEESTSSLLGIRGG